jgi:hypothetical protein
LWDIPTAAVTIRLFLNAAKQSGRLNTASTQRTENPVKGKFKSRLSLNVNMASITRGDSMKITVTTAELCQKTVLSRTIIEVS